MQLSQFTEERPFVTRRSAVENNTLQATICLLRLKDPETSNDQWYLPVILFGGTLIWQGEPTQDGKLASQQSEKRLKETMFRLFNDTLPTETEPEKPDLDVQDMSQSSSSENNKASEDEAPDLTCVTCCHAEHVDGYCGEIDIEPDGWGWPCGCRNYYPVRKKGAL